MIEIEEINKELKKIHKILSGKDEVPPLKYPVYNNGTIDPDLYYKLTIDGK